MNSASNLRMARQRRRRYDKLTLGLMAAFIVLAIISAITAFVVVRNVVAKWNMTSLPGAPEGGQVSNNPAALVTPSGEEFQVPLQSAGPTPQPWDGASRINILLLGLDMRDWEAGETPRSDTMILVTMDPVNKTAGMLSIPRDMWVAIPKFDHAKINTAYYLGEIYKIPGGGPALAAQTVEQFLGVPVDYYAQVDFYAFVKFIDTLGGLDLNVKEEIVIGRIGEPGQIKLYPGVQTLDGKSVLGYARDRYSDGDDYGRAERQQHVIMTIREQIVTLDMLPTLISKAPQLYQDLSSGIRTNLNLQQIIQLAISASQITEKNIHRAVITPDMVYNATSPDGLSILIPIPDEIRVLRDSVFTSGPAVAPAAVAGNPAELMKSEQARISIQNGTTQAGLASRTSEYFRGMGLNVVEETSADRAYSATTIVVVGGKPYTIKYLANLMKVSNGNIINRFDPNAGADVIIILGDDWNVNNPMP